MLKSTYTPPPPLPPGWTEHKAPSGHTYYYNFQTKQSTYTRPQQVTVEPPSSAPQPGPVVNAPFLSPDTLPPFSSAPYAPHGYEISSYGAPGYNQPRSGFRGGKPPQDRRRRGPEDRPKSKHAIPGCGSWVLVKTKLGRRFVHNPGTNESFWKIPAEVLKGVVEFDRLERERKERIEQGETVVTTERAASEEDEGRDMVVDDLATRDISEESDEYEEVEVTDSEGEDEDHPLKRPRTESEDKQQPVEFTEQDIEYQLAAMGEDYDLDPGEYGEPGEEGWEEGAEGLPLTDEDATALFRDLLDDFNINPFSTWEKIIEDGRIIEDTRYTVLPNMKARRDAYSGWSRDRIQTVKERKEQQEKQDPRIKYLAFLQDHATPKLYWPEFKRKYRKEPEMRDTQLSDKDREKFYRDLVSRMKLPESTRKSDLSALLKSTALHELNRSSNLEALPPTIRTDLRYIALSPKIRDPLIEAYIATLPAPPEEDITPEQREDLKKMRIEREKREGALAERQKQVQEDKRRQKGELARGRHLLEEGEAEIEEAMKIRKSGLRSHIEPQTQPPGGE
ncbi:FF domain protein [Aspergillus lucknowensis]|uniref:WW domain-containing protein n=1 Tax=Aspergillus lucknowensis TaxID=176173 RepID=A0ABR4M1P4_9EURO